MILSNKEQSKLVFSRIEAEANGFSLDICARDFNRPWGGFLRFTEESLDLFFKAYWEGVDTGIAHGRRDPKVLIVAPAQRLSLQLHHRRSELWRVLDGPVMIVHGPDEKNLVSEIFYGGDILNIPCGHIHRLVGALDSWGRVAEIWIHEDQSNPSDESDIIRLQDDYAR